MNPFPFVEAEKRAVTLQNQIVHNGEDLSGICLETGFQVFRYTGESTDLIETIGCATE